MLNRSLMLVSCAFLAALTLSCFPLSAVAAGGGSTSHGGGAHFCAKNGTAEFYDLYEGRVRYGLLLRSSPASDIEMVKDAYLKLARVNLSLAQEGYREFLHLQDPRYFRVLTDIELPPVDDINIVVVGKGCRYQQVANWDDATNSIFIDATYYKKFNAFSRAALYLHESLYKAIRKRVPKIGNSDLIRKMVAELLSDGAEIPIPPQFVRKSDVVPNLSPSEGFTSIPYAEEATLILNLGVLTEEELLLVAPAIKFSASTNGEVKQGDFLFSRYEWGCDSLPDYSRPPLTISPLECAGFAIYVKSSDAYYSAEFLANGEARHFQIRIHSDPESGERVRLTYLVR